MSKLEQLKKLLPSKKSVGYYAYKLDITEEEVLKLKKQIKIQEDTISEVKYNTEKGTLESVVEIDYLPKTDLEVAKEHKVDLTKYVIVEYYSKKSFTGKFRHTLKCRKKTEADITGNDVKEILKDYKSTYKPKTKKDILINDAFGRPCAAFIDITDFHLDKRDIYDNDIQSKIDTYQRILDQLLYKAYRAAYLDEIVFVIGSDMLHTDNFHNQTTKGTPQEVTARWNDSFKIAFDLYADSINKLKQFCNTLKVILVAGNHGRTKEFYLAFALEKYFEKETSIQFDISPAPRKVYSYGNTFIGLHHGNCKIEQLPLVFAKEFTKEWGQAKYHELKIGDKHHYMEKDYAGVRIKQLPACSNPDTWHNDNNFNTADQSAILSIYDKEKGRCIDIEEKL